MRGARALALTILMGVGCGDDQQGEDTAVLRVRSGVFVHRGDPQSTDAYARVEKRMTIDVEAKTVKIEFRDPAGRARVETYRILGR